MTKPVKLHVLGASAYPEIAELIRDLNSAGCAYEVAGLFDDDPKWHDQILEGVPVLGSLENALNDADAKLILGIGSHRTRFVRFDILERLGCPEQRFETLIHPTARVYSTAAVGQGTIIHAGSVVANGTQVGSFSVIMYNSVIGADNALGPGVLVASHVTTNSRVQIGSAAFLSSGTIVAESLKIGEGSMIGLGSVVLRNVPAGVFVLGNPPRIIETVSVPQIVSNAAGQFSVLKEFR